MNRIDFEVNITPCPLIPIPLPTSTRIYRIQCRIRFQSSPLIKIGYGVRHGAPMNPSRQQKPVRPFYPLSSSHQTTDNIVDLCQNPLTKEPKLARARQIPEWDVYDQEVAAFAKRLEGSAGKLAGSVDALAGEVGQGDRSAAQQGSHKIDEL
jgi:hypothetical protein